MLMVAVIFAIGFFNYQSAHKEVTKETILFINQTTQFTLDKDAFVKAFPNEYELEETKKI